MRNVRHLIVASLAFVPLIVACSRSGGGTEAEAPAAAQRRAAEIPKVADTNLRQLLAAIASAQACERVRNTYLGLESSDKPGVVTGNLWIRECSMTHEGTTVRFHFEGDGWQWVERETSSAGATFGVRQYARFHIAATLTGDLDLAYVPGKQVATIWFRTSKDPVIEFEPTGDIKVDEKGIWSSIVGTLAGVVSSSPGERATETVETEGTRSFERELDLGLTVTVNMCNGATRTELGVLPAGKMAPPSIGESLKADAALYGDGVMIFGPQELRETDQLTVEGYGGTVHIQVACMDEAAKVAKAFHAGRPIPAIDTIATADVSGKQQVAVKQVRCPVAVIARTKASSAGMSFVPRPRTQTALIQCTSGDGG